MLGQKAANGPTTISESHSLHRLLAFLCGIMRRKCRCNASWRKTSTKFYDNFLYIKNIIIIKLMTDPPSVVLLHSQWCDNKIDADDEDDDDNETVRPFGKEIVIWLLMAMAHIFLSWSLIIWVIKSHLQRWTNLNIFSQMHTFLINSVFHLRIWLI